MAEQTAERANILIVEDERIVGKDIELRLKKLGYRIAGQPLSSTLSRRNEMARILIVDDNKNISFAHQAPGDTIRP
jgi:hypothetical protein